MASKVQADESITRIAFWPLWMAGRLLGTMLLLSFFAIILSVAACHLRFEARLDGVRQPVTPAYLQEVQQHALQHATNGKLSQAFSEATYTLYIKKTGIHALALNPRADTAWARIVSRYPDDVAAGMIAARLFGVRTGNVILMFPLIILVIGLASVDGMAERMIRRACAGHESATLFRLTRRFAYKLLPPVIGLIYLCIPLDLSAEDVIFPGLAITALLVRTKWKYYKKHV
jgi:hypothetical protein